MLVRFPVSTVQPNNTVAGEVWQRSNFLSLVVRWKVTCALALVPFCPRAPRRGLQLLVQFPVTTVHTCQLLRNVQQSTMAIPNTAKAVRGRTIIQASYTIGYACGLPDTTLVALVYVDHSGCLPVEYSTPCFCVWYKRKTH